MGAIACVLGGRGLLRRASGHVVASLDRHQHLWGRAPWGETRDRETLGFSPGCAFAQPWERARPRRSPRTWWRPVLRKAIHGRGGASDPLPAAARSTAATLIHGELLSALFFFFNSWPTVVACAWERHERNGFFTVKDNGADKRSWKAYNFLFEPNRELCFG